MLNIVQLNYLQQKNAIVEYDQGILSTAAVAAMPYFSHTVLFIGTSQGQLLKVHVY